MSKKRTRNVAVKLGGLPIVTEHYQSPPPSPKQKGSAKGINKQKKVPKTSYFRVGGSLTAILLVVNAGPSSLQAYMDSMPEIFKPDTSGDQDKIETFTADKSQPEEKNPNHYLKRWLAESSHDYLSAFYDRDATPVDMECDSCSTPTENIYRCRSCLGCSQLCSSCLVTAHRLLPTHRTEEWNQSIWINKSLASLGLVFNLGHRGRPCEQNSSYSELLLGDLNGFTIVNVRYCTHANPVPTAKPLQLLAAGIFPCSDIQPRSSFTFSVLDQHNISTTLGKTLGHKYYSILERVTKPGFPADVSDRYRELMAVHRRFAYILNLRRSGTLYAQHSTDVHPDDQALACIACPRPGFNFNWDEVLPSERVWFRTILSYDGNQRSVRKAKKTDAGDICLSDGLAYFSLKGPYKEWTENNYHPQRTTKPACDNHKAGNDTGVRWVGQDVTGLGAIVCSSHGCAVPRGMVDFFKGERFLYADYAFASTVEWLTKMGKLDFGLTYDVWCHWIVNFLARAEALPPNLKLPPDLDLVGGIPKWHMVGHALGCYTRWNINWTEFFGRIEGEAVERFWAHMNQVSGSTSEQGPGIRTDTLNNVVGDLNFQKLITMGDALHKKFKKAVTMYKKQEEAHKELGASITPEKVAEWETLPTEAVKGSDGKWTRPLMDPVADEHSFLAVVNGQQEREAASSHISGRKHGVTRWLSKGVKLEHSMWEVADEARKLGSDPTPQSASNLNESRMELYDTIMEHRKEAELFMLEIDKPDHPDRPVVEGDDPECMELGLPSLYLRKTLNTANLSSLAELEKTLRQAMCSDELESVKRLLGARAVSIKYRNEQVRGEKAVTRAASVIRVHTDKITRATWRYLNSRSALIRLGVTGADLKKYKDLVQSDLKPLSQYLATDSLNTGQGYAAISWIWQSAVAPNVDEWEVNALKTEWFRSRERYKRWKEQLVLGKREMVTAIRDLQRRQGIWGWKATAGNPTPGMVVHALKKSMFFGELAQRALDECLPDLKDDIVTLEWSTEWVKKNVDIDSLLLPVDFS